MSTTSFRALFGAAALALASTAAAQCQFSSLSAQSAGAFCNISSTGCCAIPSAPCQLLPLLDVTNCTVVFTVHQLEGCCGITVPFRFLAIGMTPAVIPLPGFGPTCTLWLVPDQFFVMTTATIAIPIPPTLPPLTFQAQGAALVNDPFGPVNPVMTISGALAISLQ